MCCSCSLLSYHIPARSHVPPTPICCRFLRSRQSLSPAVSVLPSPQYGTHSLLAFALVHHHTHSVLFLKPTVLSRPAVPRSGSHKCLRFSLWLTLHAIEDFIYLLIIQLLLITCLCESVLCIFSCIFVFLIFFHVTLCMIQ